MVRAPASVGNERNGSETKGDEDNPGSRLKGQRQTRGICRRRVACRRLDEHLTCQFLFLMPISHLFADGHGPRERPLKIAPDRQRYIERDYDLWQHDLGVAVVPGGSTRVLGVSRIHVW